MEVELRAAVALDHQPGEIAAAAGVATLGRGVGGELGNGRAEALTEDDIHDALVGAVAIFERDFLGQDLDPLDRLGRDVAKLAEARDALAVEQKHRLFAAAAARASDLGRERSQQFADVGRSGRAHIARVERLLGRNVADHRAARALPGNDDLLLVAIFVDRLGRRPSRGGRTRRLGLGWRRDLPGCWIDRQEKSRTEKQRAEGKS